MDLQDGSLEQDFIEKFVVSKFFCCWKILMLLFSKELLNCSKVPVK